MSTKRKSSSFPRSPWECI